MSQVLEAHRRAVHADLQTMSSTLVQVLGRVLVAGIVGVRNPKTISRWASGEVTSVRDRYSEERLLATYQIVTFLQDYEADATIRAFMIGMNPELNDQSPARGLIDGRYTDVMAAAKGLVAGSY